ncbi:MAG: alpha-glucuronidase family glycosyl hydrolase [Acidobacteriaceae bacterium]
MPMRVATGALLFGVVASPVFAGQGADASAATGPGAPAWLAYLPVNAADVFPAGVPDTVLELGNSAVEDSASREISAGWKGMLRHTPRVVHAAKDGDRLKVVLGTQAEIRAWNSHVTDEPLAKDAYHISRQGPSVVIEGGDDRGVLYGAFALLREIAEQHSLKHFNESSAPWAAVRWTNEWDNPNGTIERGYAGPSIFFEDGKVRADLSRAAAYARLLSSVGIDGCTINNVNAAVDLLKPENIKEIARIADVFRPYGVRLSMSVAISSPTAVGGLETFDPLDPKVAAWWRNKMDEIYAEIPDFGGVVVKADSEGQAGPSRYGRSQADAANVVARALKPHGGIVLYRAFVYNNHLDWHDMKADRARAGYDIFHPLDGKFDDNVVVQIKYGPIDFQVREPVSPIFAGLPHTNEAIELQITQEYTGQSRHLVYLPPMWKISLDTDMRASTSAAPLPVKLLVSGRSVPAQHHTLGGFVGVSNVGTDGWLGNPMSLANLYGFGRLAWDPDLSAAAISDEWTRLTLGNDPEVRTTVNKLQLDSWHIYESYTGPLGVGTLTDILGSHYGPGIESAEHNGWGQWIRADHEGVGMNRTVATGTGYIGQYPAPLAAEYESLATCPDDLLLFMHHVPYTYRLHSGLTVMQYIDNSHYWGAQAAAEQIPMWQKLQGKVPDATYSEVLKRLKYQAGAAIVWRDAITRWFTKESGVPDALGRVGNYPGRVEAESMKLDGYSVVDVKPWETASGGKAVICEQPECSVQMTWTEPDGWYDIAVQYFDLLHGHSRFVLSVAGNEVEHWVANDKLPGDTLNGSTSTRRVLQDVAIHRGDVVKITGWPDGIEKAPLDYVTIVPHKHPPIGARSATH